MLVSGRVIDRFTRRSKQAYALVPAASLTLAVPFYLAFVWAPSWRLALLFLTGTMFLNYFYLTSAVTLVQEEVRPDQRVMSGALLLLIMNLIGLGLGPTFVGAASDFFHASHPHQSLQIALYMLASFYVVAVLLFLGWHACFSETKAVKLEEQSDDPFVACWSVVARAASACLAPSIFRSTGYNYVTLHPMHKHGSDRERSCRLE